MSTVNTNDHRLDVSSLPPNGDTRHTGVDLLNQARKALEAVRLVELGRRARLVRQLTGLEKKVVNRLYHQLRGRPSPPGQTPFCDTWYRQNDRRMAHANVVWRLFQCLKQWERSAARMMINVYESYKNLVQTPMLDLTRAAFVPNLVRIGLWRERVCEHCHMSYIAPAASHTSTCPACKQYFNYRCRLCVTAMKVHPKGRRRKVCAACTEAQKRAADKDPH